MAFTARAVIHHLAPAFKHNNGRGGDFVTSLDRHIGWELWSHVDDTLWMDDLWDSTVPWALLIILREMYT